MRRVTRDIDPSEAHDLLLREARACIAVAGDDEPCVEPAIVAFRDGRYFVGLPSDSGTSPAVGEEVVLLIDEGCRFFQRRALYVRGRVGLSAGEAEGLVATFDWFVIEPTRIAAWDYGRLHEAEHAP